MTRPPVVFVAGSGRSGSTLVERIIGAVPGYVNVGEILDLPRRVVADDELCGCGESFSDCEFWRQVGDRLADGPTTAWRLPGWSRFDLDRLDRLQGLVARQRHLPRLLLPARSDGFGAAVEEYGARYNELFSAVLSTAAASFVVDASKWPSQALALHRGGVDVRVLHLVRDVRGVAHSLSKAGLARPHAREGGTTTMYSKPVAKGAARWLTTQTEIDLLAAVGVPIARVHYDEVVTRPVPVLSSALARLGCRVPDGGFDHVGGTPTAPVVTLPASHGLSGNPSRFKLGEVALRSDDAWRSSLSAGQRGVALGVGLPQALRYRWARQRGSK